LCAQLAAGRKALGIVSLGGAHASHSLAWTLAQWVSGRGQNALLLDFDRAGKLRGAFQVATEPGFAEFAAGKAALAAVSRQLEGQISLMGPGSAQLSSEQLASAWLKLFESNQLVICVLPTPSQWTVQATLLPLLDSVVISVGQAAVPTGAIQLAAARLRQLGCSPLGVVVTEFSTERDALGSAELPFLAVETQGRI
jgi:hypothetical protein